ncbi:hypothetical protein MesoLj131c_68310 (plasmid) [Mesorhizobium sp. 131-3-5]|nr:hypothetical protein MesoLj131c_68310 [Mesorhizobium sp. 131-3-5]
MRENCTSGSVRGGGSNAPTYSAFDPLQSSQLGAESGRVGQAGKIAEEAKLAGVEGVLQALQE